MAGQLSGATSEIALVGIDLFKPFEFEFFRNGVFVATLAGALCGVVGCRRNIVGRDSLRRTCWSVLCRQLP